MTVCARKSQWVFAGGRLRRMFVCVLAAASTMSTVNAAETAASAKAPPGAIVGVVTNTTKLPVGQATITATTADGRVIRATVSASDGVYSLADLPPGTWSLTTQIDGYPQVAAPPLTVTSGKATRYDIVMAGGSTNSVAPVAAAQPQAISPSFAAAVKAAVQTVVPEALQAPDAGPEVDNFTPFAFGDFTWLNGSPRNHKPVFDTKFFTPDIRLDASFIEEFAKPKDHTIVGSTEAFRSGEVQLEQVSFGGDFHWDNVRARFLSMFGMFATTTPRNDASQAVGQWDLRNAYRYLSEANAGYHFDVNHGLNVDAGIFVSYIGLFSYYNFDNWVYQPSYVSSNTPWFFNGVRIQWFPTNTLKIEPWIINGWQSYARFNGHLGFGGQVLWMPNDSLKLVFNNYGIGQDNLGLPHTERIHTDDSIEVKYYQNKDNGHGPSKMAFSYTVDWGCQYGGGINCTGGPNRSEFFGMMLYNRIWFDHDRYAVTIGGGFMSNPGRYLTLLPPINGADAVSGSPYFTENPGQSANMWDTNINVQYMPKEWVTFWTEFGYRHSNVPYFSGPGGVTPPGGNNGSPANYVCNSGSTAGTNNLQQAQANCGGDGSVWFPDLQKTQMSWSAGILVKF
jgi:Putative beta-barrel porin-2, OmpL-like. bbp2/Carboxypeptidase regulatory-like domain